MSRKHNSPGIYFREIAMKNPNAEGKVKKTTTVDSSTTANITHQLNTSYRVKVEPYRVDMIQPDSVDLKAYFSTELYGEVLNKQEITDFCEWYVDSVDATVENGTVTINKTGVNAEVAAAYKGFKGKAYVTVKSVNSYYLELSTTSVNLNRGEKVKITAKYYQIKDSVLQEGIDVTDTCEWTSDNANISVLNGTVTSNKSGVSGMVTAKYNGEEASVSVAVASSYRYVLKLSETNIKLNKDENKTITATYFVIIDDKTDNGTDVTLNCEWISNNPSAISVNNGSITAIKSGVNGIITAKYEGLTVSINVEVPSVTSSRTLEISVVSSITDMVAGTNGKIKALYTEVKDDNTNTIDVSDKCSWHYDSSIISVNKGDVSVISTGKSGVIYAVYDGVTSNSLDYSTKSIITNKLTISFVEGYTSSFNVDGETRLIATLQTTTDGVITQNDVTNVCNWTSSNESAISVANGVITGTLSGQRSTIQANYSGITSNTIVVSTKSNILTSLVITPSSFSLNKSESTQLTVKYYRTVDGVTDNGENVTTSCTWEYDSSKLHLTNGKVTALVDDATVTVIAKYNGETSNVTTITINPRAEVITYSLELTPNSVEMLEDEVKQLTATYYQLVDGVKTGKGTNVTSDCEWVIDNNKITVDDEGLLTSSEGDVNGTVYATYNGCTSNTISVNIINTVVEKLVISPSGSIELTPGTTKQLTAYLVTEDNGVEKGKVDVTTSCSWSSSNNNDVTVYLGLVGSNAGNVTSTITATYNNLTDSISVKFGDLVSYSLIITPESVVMNMGESYQFTAELVEYKNGVENKRTDITTKSGITWTCGSTVEVGRVDGGLFTPAKSGINATISAVYADGTSGLFTSNKVTAIVQSEVKHEIIVTPNNIALDKDFVEYLTVKYRTTTDGVVTKEVDVTDQCTFTPVNSNVITVDSNGMVTAIGNNTLTSIKIDCFVANIDKTLSTNCAVILRNENLEYMYIQTLENDTEITFSGGNTLNYSFDGSNWLGVIGEPSPLTVPSPTRVYFKATGLTATSQNGIGTFNATKPINAGGNVMSLILGDGYNDFLEGNFNVSTLPSYLFCGLFSGCTTLQRVSTKFLPLTKLPSYCYMYMFKDCTSLLNSPNLIKLDNLTTAVYAGMFENCKSLKATPTIDIETILNPFSSICEAMFRGCTSIKSAANVTLNATAPLAYMDMFLGCTNLKIGANIMATSLAQNVCRNMYNGCRNLTYIKMLALSVNPDSNAGHLADWVTGVAPTGTFVKHKNATWNITGNSGVPEGWEIIYEDENGAQTHETMVSGYVTSGGATTYSMRRSAPAGVSNVTVGIYGTTNMTTTDENGYYEFPQTDDEFNSGKIICYADGYEPQIVDINQTNQIDIPLEVQTYDEMFKLERENQEVDLFDVYYDNFIRIKVPGKTEDVVNEFDTSVNEEAQSWLKARGIRYIIPTNNGGPIEGEPPYLSFGFDVEENKGKKRVGHITITHTGGWSGVYTIVQSAPLLMEEISEDAFKEVIPGKTPWFSTRNQDAFPDYNWGRAEKVLYLDDNIKNPSGSVYVPGVTEHTTVKYNLTEVGENCSDDVSDWCFDNGNDNGWWTSNYDGFKHYGINLGPTQYYMLTKATHRTVVFTFLVSNYNNTIGNQFAFSVRVVQCKSDINKKEFDELVDMYGTSNYDGTMNDLSKFYFGKLPEPTKVVRGTTPYVTTYEWSNETYTPPVSGYCDRVLYMTYKSKLVPFKQIYPDGVSSMDSRVIVCRDGGDNELSKWLVSGLNNSYTIGSTTDFIPKDTENHRVIDFNFHFEQYDGENKPYKKYDIPFKVVQCKEGITREEFKALVVKYGTSNYDGTMGRLDDFEFWREVNDFNLDDLIGTWTFKNDTSRRLTIVKRNGSYTFQTGASTFVGSFNLQISENDDVIIVGSADENGDAWEHVYKIQTLNSKSMTWVAIDDNSIIYEYIRA